MEQHYAPPAPPSQMPRRRKKQLAPWERALRRYWPPARLLLIGANLICILVLLISLLIKAII